VTIPDDRVAARADGALMRPWSTIAAISWALVVAAQTAIGVTSGNVGRPTYWIGPLGDTRPVILWLVPVVAPIVAFVCALFARHVAWRAGVVAALWVTAMAVIDLSVSRAVALVEFVVAASAWLVVVATAAGRPTRPSEPPLPLSP
jgi:hypothetical protein